MVKWLSYDTERYAVAPVRNIDVSGLSPAAIRAVESLVDQLRQSPASSNGKSVSIFDLFGAASNLRSADDIDRQVLTECRAWGEK